MTTSQCMCPNKHMPSQGLHQPLQCRLSLYRRSSAAASLEWPHQQQRCGHSRQTSTAARQAQPRLQTETEAFLEQLQEQQEALEDQAGQEQGPIKDAHAQELEAQLEALKQQVATLQQSIDALYRSAFEGMADHLQDGSKQLQGLDMLRLQGLSEAAFGELGRTQPEVLQALLQLRERVDAVGWARSQQEIQRAKLQRQRARRELEDVQAALDQAAAAAKQRAADMGDAAAAVLPLAGKQQVRMCLITGFESFNSGLYQQAARELHAKVPNVQLLVFSDRDLEPKRAQMEAALDGADVFFGSLLFDYDQVEWLQAKIKDIPLRLVFESALELMSATQIGTFQMKPSGKGSGPPPVIKKLLGMFGSQREEDRMVGYLSFLKIGPQLLRFLPGKKAKDLRNWLTVYGYWNQGGLKNVVSMFVYLLDQYQQPTGVPVSKIVETPALGCLHPAHEGYFTSPAQYMHWYARHGPLRVSPAAPTVAVLIYRKHVITEQPYIPQLIASMEAEGVRPVPIFINGIEAHTVVRDLLTSTAEQQHEQQGRAANPTLKKDAVVVDAVVSTIGFPLVGGPAGTMEGGRQADVARGILKAKNFPYIVAAPLLIQDMASWMRDGVAGLQSVVLYSLPELDGAIDTVPLGGLVGDNIFIVGERVRRLSQRLRKWVELRRTPLQERKLAILLYGFPPGVGATGTAALLNVPQSLANLLESLQGAGYDLGPAVRADGSIDGEAIIAALKMQEDQRTVYEGKAGIERRGSEDAAAFGAEAAAEEIAPAWLKDQLTYPESWGPSEWGPIPFLPANSVLVDSMEQQWGSLGSYRGIQTTASGKLLVNGLQLGNVFIGVQPALGLEGDPMRLLFERDLTPHPQYAAFYKWLQNGYGAHAVLHFGMHGTVEWLPGAPLGNTGLSWSDVLLGDLPNVYVYACNNPSESILAKRRGYGTIVSHNVPPYGRAGLYKQMSEIKGLVDEYREAPDGSAALRGPIVELLGQAGLDQDCPFRPDTGSGGSGSGNGAQQGAGLTVEEAAALPEEQFSAWVGQIYQYLQVLEQRLFSEGLHVLGMEPPPDKLQQYLSAYFGEDLPEEAVAAVARSGRDNLAAVKARLERTIQQGGAAGVDDGRLAEAVQIRGLLQRNTEEMTGILRALNGEYIEPEAGGDLLRDGAGVLPTGRNIHALDPYRMPSPAALERGAAAGQGVIEAHQAANAGALPETVAVNLWGLDAIKTKGESVAIVLHLVGARPVREGTGRVARFELVPLQELGRPRIDVLCNMSGIFRDSFQNVVDLLDDLFRRAAQASEPAEQNFIRKHSGVMEQEGLTNSSARLFSNPAGDYGSMVNERVGASDWENGAELGDTWASRNAFSYGRGKERGTPRPEVLQSLLRTTDRVVQEIDSVEYGLTDIQEYYANTGALKRAAESARGDGSRVGCSIVETFSKDAKPRELEEVLRLEYRSKLLNPKWAKAMADQGSGGAFEISQRMTAMIGWGATSSFAEKWVFDQAADTYVMDAVMAERLRRSNPQAFQNMVKRFLEASGRGMWQADQATLEQLKQMYSDLDAQMEGVTN